LFLGDFKDNGLDTTTIIFSKTALPAMKMEYVVVLYSPQRIPKKTKSSAVGL
jgi:hypothetical protein